MKMSAHHPMGVSFTDAPISCRERLIFNSFRLLSLTLFVFWIFLVDHIEATFAADNLVLGGTLLD